MQHPLTYRHQTYNCHHLQCCHLVGRTDHLRLPHSHHLHVHDVRLQDTIVKAGYQMPPQLQPGRVPEATTNPALSLLLQSQWLPPALLLLLMNAWNTDIGYEKPDSCSCHIMRQTQEPSHSGFLWIFTPYIWMFSHDIIFKKNLIIVQSKIYKYICQQQTE